MRSKSLGYVVGPIPDRVSVGVRRAGEIGRLQQAPHVCNRGDSAENKVRHQPGGVRIWIQQWDIDVRHGPVVRAAGWRSVAGNAVDRIAELKLVGDSGADD